MMHDSVYGCVCANGWSSWRTCAKNWLLWSLHVQVEREETMVVMRRTRTRVGEIWGLGGHGYCEMVEIALEHVEIEGDTLKLRDRSSGGLRRGSFGNYWQIWKESESELFWDRIRIRVVLDIDRALCYKRRQQGAACVWVFDGSLVLRILVLFWPRFACSACCGCEFLWLEFWVVLAKHFVDTNQER